MNTLKPVICWFRQDLRLSDNPAFFEASQKKRPIIPIYILDDINSAPYSMGGASRFWLHESLKSLNDQLNGCLSLYKGDPFLVLQKISQLYGVCDVFWNRCYEPWRMVRDEHIKKELRKHGLNVHSYQASLLWEPWHVVKDDQTPYKVFTPFYKRGCLLNKIQPRNPLPLPVNSHCMKDDQLSIALVHLDLLSNIGWHQSIQSCWDIGEEKAHHLLDEFIEDHLLSYRYKRDFPDLQGTSKLSAYLHFGQISPNQMWHTIKNIPDSIHNEHVDCFLSELCWREFSYNLLYFNHDLAHKNLRSSFDAFPWNNDPHDISAWKKGLTGYPIIDAGMRQLWQSGYMHNRVRMIVGSFLTKNLLVDWRIGRDWFWDCLLDADLASNSASWQWIAGCGADAVPYFRIFNPTTQAQKFDPDGSYIKTYVPELKKLPQAYLFTPWKAPAHVLKDAGIALGKDYPNVIVDLSTSRTRALNAFKTLKHA